MKHRYAQAGAGHADLPSEKTVWEVGRKETLFFSGGWIYKFKITYSLCVATFASEPHKHRLSPVSQVNDVNSDKVR